MRLREFGTRQAAEQQLRDAENAGAEAASRVGELEAQRTRLNKFWHYFKRRSVDRHIATAVAAAPATTLSARSPVGSSSVRPISQETAGARVHIVAPGRFADAQEIANRLMSNQPVIVNMQSADRDLQRRMIDFCSGVTYALSGGMERVADEVFLLTPSNVKVSEEERQRLTDRGLVNP